MATTCATCLTAGRRTLAALLRSRGISELSVRCWGRCLSTNVTAGEMCVLNWIIRVKLLIHYNYIVQDARFFYWKVR